MSFRAFLSKSKSTESDPTELTIETTVPEIEINDHQIFDIEKLQNEIASKEKTLNISINHSHITLDANIDDIKFLIDQKRPEQKIYKSSICDIWLRLKTIEQMDSPSLINFLQTNQLHRTEKDLYEIDNNPVDNEQQNLLNPRRSRLTHFHISTESDEFSLDVDSYIGLLMFSYDNQSKFILNEHHCQRGDIIIKQLKFFSHKQTLNRGIYDTLFKWYFNRSIDERFFGIGFLYSNGKWRFDLIAYDDRDLLSYEYQIFDMYILTHWLTQIHMADNAQEMEINAKTLLLDQYEIAKKKLIDPETIELLNYWNGSVGNEGENAKLNIEKFIQTIEKDIEIIFNETKTNNLSELLTQNT